MFVAWLANPCDWLAFLCLLLRRDRLCMLFAALALVAQAPFAWMGYELIEGYPGYPCWVACPAWLFVCPHILATRSKSTPDMAGAFH